MSPFKITDDAWYEVTSDILFLDGSTFHRGDLIAEIEIGARVGDMIRLGMIRSKAVNRRVA